MEPSEITPVFYNNFFGFGGRGNFPLATPLSGINPAPNLFLPTPHCREHSKPENSLRKLMPSLQLTITMFLLTHPRENSLINCLEALGGTKLIQDNRRNSNFAKINLKQKYFSIFPSNPCLASAKFVEWGI